MDIKGKCKSFTISDNYFLVQVEAHIDIHVELVSCFRLSVSMLNTTAKNREEIEDTSGVYLSPSSGNH
jgi:hypothetical protein